MKSNKTKKLKEKKKRNAECAITKSHGTVYRFLRHVQNTYFAFFKYSHRVRCQRDISIEGGRKKRFPQLKYIKKKGERGGSSRQLNKKKKILNTK